MKQWFILKEIRARPHPANPAACERKDTPMLFLHLKIINKTKPVQMSFKEGAMFQTKQAADYSSFSCMIMAWELWRVKELWNFPLRVRKVTKARLAAEKPLNGGPERPLCEAENVRPEHAKGPQDAGSSRDIWCLPKAGCRKWSQTKREKSAIVTKARRAEVSKHFDTHVVIEWKTGPVDFQSCFGSSLGPFPPMWDGNEYSASLYAAST